MRRPAAGASVPIALVLVALAAALFFGAPLVGLVARSSWAEARALAASAEVRAALGLSIVVSLAATALSLACGFPLAWLLARARVPGLGLLRTLVTLPLVLPPVVAGVALLAAFGRRGLLGEPLAALGLSLPFTTLAAILAAFFVSAPFLITTLEAAIAELDPHYEQAAATLGASRWRILWTVVLPAIRPSLFAGLALSWARALGEFGATITFAGNLPGRTQTVPLAIYQTLQTSPERAFLLGCLLLAASAVVLGIARGRRRLA